MSVHCVSWAWKQTVGDHVAKTILVKLADNANDEGVAWPGVERVSRETEIPLRTVKRKLTYLEDQGFLSRQQQRNEAGSWGKTIYQLHRVPERHPVGPSVTEGIEPGATECQEVQTGGQRVREPFVGKVSKSNHPLSAEGSAQELVPTRDAIWEALTVATGVTPESHGERTKRGMSVRELVQLDATPEEVVARAKNFEERYPGATVTDRAIVNRWGELANGAQRKNNKRRYGTGVTPGELGALEQQLKEAGR